MSRLVIMEVAMKEELPDLYDIYFGGQILIHYDEKIPFVVVATTLRMGADAAVELLSGCDQFKLYHKLLFAIDVKSYVTDEKKFKKVKNWRKYFHTNRLYR
jgi:hypothetical protein